MFGCQRGLFSEGLCQLFSPAGIIAFIMQYYRVVYIIMYVHVHQSTPLYANLRRF